MNFKVILCALIVVELVQLSDAKRSFGLTSRRSKSKSPSVRRGQHGHDGDDHVPIPKAPAQPANNQKNIGWNTQQAHNTHNAPSAPSGPITASHVPQGGLYSGNPAHQPPAYGSSYGAPPAYNPHHGPSAYGAPPAYGAPSSFGAPPPAYSQGGYNQPRQAYGNSYGAPQMGASPYSQNMHYGNNQMMGGSPMMAGGMMGGGQMMGGGMGVPMMGVMPMQMQSQSRGSGLGSGLMTNLFAGLAGYQIAKAFSGNSHGSGYNNHNNNQERERDIIIINNPPAQQITTADGTVVQPIAPVSNAYPHTPLNPPPVSSVASVPGVSSDTAILTAPPDESPKIPQEAIPEAPVASLPQLVPTNNEYNYWGLPQYGIPLYGYNLPSQITEYYQIDTIKLNHDSQQQQQAEQTTTSSAATSS